MRDDTRPPSPVSAVRDGSSRGRQTVTSTQLSGVESPRHALVSSLTPEMVASSFRGDSTTNPVSHFHFQGNSLPFPKTRTVHQPIVTRAPPIHNPDLSRSLSPLPSSFRRPIPELGLSSTLPKILLYPGSI